MPAVRAMSVSRAERDSPRVSTERRLSGHRTYAAPASPPAHGPS